MGIATPPILSHSKNYHTVNIGPLVQVHSNECNSGDHYSASYSSSMSQDYHQAAAGIFAFSSNGFERPSSQALAHQEHHQQQQHHLAQQIRRDKLRGYEPPPPTGPLVGIEEEESGGLPVYETAGMLSEMFNFPPGGPAELLDQPLQSNYHRTQQPRQLQPQQQQQQTVTSNNEWFNSSSRQGIVIGGLGPLGDSKNHHHQHHNNHHQISGINADPAAAMQLFLMNPQPRSPSPAPAATSSTLHMLLPNPSTSLQGFTVSGPGGNYGATNSDQISHPQFTWVPDSSHQGANNTSASVTQLNNPTEIASIVEGQGLSLSLSSSLQHLEAVKAEELRMGEGGLLYYNHQTGGSGSSSAPYYKNLSGQHQAALHLQPGGVGVGQNHQVHVGYGSSLGVVNVLRNSKYIKAAQELLEEFCSVGRGQFKKNKFSRQSTNPSSNNPGGNSSGGGSGGGGGGGSSSSTKDFPPLSASDRIEHQRRKVKLLSMLDEVDRRYNHYCEQMQMVVNSFDLVMGFGAAVPYTSLAQKAMSRHFRCLKDAIGAQLKHSCELLGEKDGAGTSGITKGETPRLRLLEQSLRQQRAFHQMGMMEQEAWRPQRGLPERSVNILRAWLFEHFLHPSDADKHLLARQTGLSRNQVSNWFINARVRLWKPMVEEMYQQESKDEDGEDRGHQSKQNSSSNNNNNNNNTSGQLAQTSTPTTTNTNTSTTPTASSSPTITTPKSNTPTPASAASKRSDIGNENDPSHLLAMNRQCFSENQATNTTSTTIITPTINTTTTEMVAPPLASPHGHQPFHDLADDICRRGSIVTGDYGTTGSAAGADHIGSTLIRFGTTTAAAGDVSLTLGLRHAGNMPEKNTASAFSVRDFGNC
eukprot:XP_015576757.1 BEL1-like homeodomain protein 4 [Ricinus communis]